MAAVVSIQKSTTVRSRSAARAAALRLGLGTLGAVAPGLAGRVAGRLFLVPPRTAGSDRERALIGDGEPFALDVDGVTLRGFRRGEGPAVLLVHGWGGRAGQLAAFVPPLLAAGCSVVAFDGPAHGASGGRVASVPHFARAAEAVAAALGVRAAVGHSMGAAALGLAVVRGLPLDAVVLVGPPRSPEQFFDAACRAFGLGVAARAAARARLERRVGERMADLDLPRAAARLDTPALIVHDGDDREVPWSDGAAIAGAWPGAELATTEGLGHRRILRAPRVVDAAVTFIAARLRRCACGRLADASGRCAGCRLADHLYDREARRAIAGRPSIGPRASHGSG